MKKIVFIIVVLSFIYSESQGQQKRSNLSADAEINALLQYKREYEKYSEFAKSNAAKTCSAPMQRMPKASASTTHQD